MLIFHAPKPKNMKSHGEPQKEAKGGLEAKCQEAQ